MDFWDCEADGEQGRALLGCRLITPSSQLEAERDLETERDLEKVRALLGCRLITPSSQADDSNTPWIPLLNWGATASDVVAFRWYAAAFALLMPMLLSMCIVVVQSLLHCSGRGRHSGCLGSASTCGDGAGDPPDVWGLALPWMPFGVFAPSWLRFFIGRFIAVMLAGSTPPPQYVV